MEAHEIIRQAVDRAGAKVVADALGVSLSLVYKWAQPPLQGGVVNPLDRVAQLREITGEQALIEWLCARAGGYYVKNGASREGGSYEILPATQTLVRKFADLLSSISKAAANERICPVEAAEIRQVWDRLKAHAEGFVRCCEAGEFAGVENRSFDGKRVGRPEKFKA